MSEYTIVDVGCRFGPRAEWLKLDCHIIGFVPDPAECSRLQAKYPKHTFVPLALDSSSGSRKFWITEDPQCCSFYKPIQQLVPDGLAGHRILGQGEVQAVRLDYWMEANCPSVNVDLLKIDTQGSECRVLQGSESILASVLWVITEVEFNPLYEDQPLFSDVDTELRRFGFELCGFEGMRYRHNQLYWADAYYFRPPLLGRTLQLAKAIGAHP